MGVVYLVRHGQASFGADDYDQLSSAGERQARDVGLTMARVGLEPDAIVCGSLRRQEQTAGAIVAALSPGRSVEIDPAWNEFDHTHVAASAAATGPAADSRLFQRELEAGLRVWVDGMVTHGESFQEFDERTVAALDRVATGLGNGGSALIVSSGGVISWLATVLIGGGVEQWIRLNRVCVNAAITKVVIGRQGRSLVSFNEHGHIPHADVTYR